MHIQGVTNQAAEDDAFANNGLFVGAHATAAHGSAVLIEGPDGDLSHLATNSLTTPVTSVNEPMLCCGNPNSPDQSEPRDYNAEEIEIMTDLGYTPNALAVPEPA